MDVEFADEADTFERLGGPLTAVLVCIAAASHLTLVFRLDEGILTVFVPVGHVGLWVDFSHVAVAAGVLPPTHLNLRDAHSGLFLVHGATCVLYLGHLRELGLLTFISFGQFISRLPYLVCLVVVFLRDHHELQERQGWVDS